MALGIAINHRRRRRDSQVSTRQRQLSKEEIARAFSTAASEPCPAILSPRELAALVGISVKTVYEWIAQGRLDGAFRKRGKHILLWRDRAVDILFNGKDWK
jgi:excisionase family DNA binding protein